MDEQQTPNPIPPIPESKPVNLGARKKEIILVSAVVFLALAAGVLGYWLSQKNQEKNNSLLNKQQQDRQTNNQEKSDSPVTGINPQTNSSTATEDGNKPSDVNQNSRPPVPSDRGPLIASKSGIVEWINPEKINDSNILQVQDPNEGYPEEFTYKVGRFLSGKYAGGDLLVVFGSYEMGPGDAFRVVKQGNVYTILDKYSDSNPKLIKIGLDKNFTLQDLDVPQTLHSTNPKADFTLAESLGFFKSGHDFFYTDYRTKIFTDPVVGDVYADELLESNDAYWPRQGFYVKSPDGLEYVYQLNIGFIGKDNVPLISWNNGKRNSQEYSFQNIGGCGASNFRDVVNLQQGDLTQIGTTVFGGQPIYGYKDSNNSDLKNMYDSTYVPDGKSKGSYEEFLNTRPIFFWKDPFGKFIRFKSTKYQPMAECGKPVIYLYPEKTQEISVKVEPQGGFTFTEPDYNGGWNVISDPLSNITNIADGKIYPYLFWEGRGGMYETPRKGFVVAKNNVHSFLQDKLYKLGLNNKESADFMEFWEPKMKDSPYYFITFMGNNVMDGIAPLTITPKPDTVIRILMDFTELQQPIAVEGFNMRTPERKGFTVVEWGGVLRK